MGIPILVLVLVRGNINLLGDMYAFGLLGAFSLTCLGMDIVRYRQRKARRIQASQSGSSSNSRDGNRLPSTPDQAQETTGNQASFDGQAQQEQANPDEVPEPEGRWTRSTLNFYLGILTTFLVVTAWTTNLIAKPLATAFGGSVTALGMLIAYTNYRFHLKKGRVPVPTTGVELPLPGAI
ncbi:MAG: hypothetical protein E6I97_23685, partial [Chloroflexi bacterium]